MSSQVPRLVVPVVFLGASAIVTPPVGVPVHAQLSVADPSSFKEAILRSPDPDDSDFFGSPVEIHGDRLVVGARGDDECASNAGAAYVYRRLGLDWAFEQKLMASDCQPDDRFGSDVDIFDDYIVVGANQEDTQGEDAGAAYVFEWVGGMNPWAEDQKLLAFGDHPVSGLPRGDPFDSFGFSVAIDASVPAEDPGAGLLYTIVAGAPKDEGDDSGSVGPGGIYIFQLSGGGIAWSPKGYFTIDPPFSTSTEEFGWSVDIHEDGIAVGAPEEQLDFGSGTGIQETGAAYYLQRRSIGSIWTVEHKFQASVPGPGDFFGWSVALQGDGFGTYTVVVGAPDDDDFGGEVGSFFTYQGNTNLWAEQIHGPADPTSIRSLGDAVNIDGSLIIVGAPESDPFGTDNGAIFLFERTGNTWTERGRLGSSQSGQTFLRFGERVSVVESPAPTFASSTPADDAVGTDQGSVHVYNAPAFSIWIASAPGLWPLRPGDELPEASEAR